MASLLLHLKKLKEIAKLALSIKDTHTFNIFTYVLIAVQVYIHIYTIRQTIRTILYISVLYMHSYMHMLTSVLLYVYCTEQLGFVHAKQ